MDGKLLNLADKIHWGIEYEGLRVNSDGTLSTQKHPFPMEHKQITKDFAECQAELVGKPFSKSKDCIKNIENLKKALLEKIPGEGLWPFSMPPFIKNDQEIPLADFGTSEKGLIEGAYRKKTA